LDNPFEVANHHSSRWWLTALRGCPATYLFSFTIIFLKKEACMVRFSDTEKKKKLGIKFKDYFLNKINPRIKRIVKNI
jgi:hypothetical protein